MWLPSGTGRGTGTVTPVGSLPRTVEPFGCAVPQGGLDPPPRPGFLSVVADAFVVTSGTSRCLRRCAPRRTGRVGPRRIRTSCRLSTPSRSPRCPPEPSFRDQSIDIRSHDESCHTDREAPVARRTRAGPMATSQSRVRRLAVGHTPRLCHRIRLPEPWCSPPDRPIRSTAMPKNARFASSLQRVCSADRCDVD